MDWITLYIIAGILLLPAFLYGGISQLSSLGTFERFSKTNANCEITASELAKKLLDNASVSNVEIVRINGRLTDCYDPRNKVIKLSEATYNSSSIAAIGVCAHEVGHAIQDANNSFLFRLRIKFVPIVNFLSRLYIPLILAGSILSFVLYIETIGYYIALTALIMYGASMIFHLITLPLEYDASKKALQLLEETETLTNGELYYANKVLKAAIQTYIAALITSVLYFLRFLSYAMIFDRN